MDQGAWWAIAHEIAKSWAQLSKRAWARWKRCCFGHEEASGKSLQMITDWSCDLKRLKRLKLPGQQYPHLQNEEDPISLLLSVLYHFVILSVVSSVSMDIKWFLYQSASAQKTGQCPLPRALTPKAVEHSYSSTHILESIKTASYSQGDWEIVWMSWRVANPTSSFLKFKL